MKNIVLIGMPAVGKSTVGVCGYGSADTKAGEAIAQRDYRAGRK